MLPREGVSKMRIALGLRHALRPVDAACVPMFALGPLDLLTVRGKRRVQVAFATTEQLLPESIQRGIGLINLSGGCVVRVLGGGMTRTPVFSASSLDAALKVSGFIKSEKESFNSIVAQASRHAKLQSVKAWVVGRFIYVRFGFSTGDAMGMNMVTLATEMIAEHVVKNTGCQLVALSSNMCADKKPAGVNFLLGRGKTVIAEASIDAKLLSETCRVSAHTIHRIVSIKDHVGSALALSPGFLNAQVANVLAGIFIATGQDVAQVVESSMAIVLSEIDEHGRLVLSITLPCLEIGTIGGGTGFPYAFRALELMGCAGGSDPAGRHVDQLAEILAGACLAGELSLLASLSEGTLASVHRRRRRESR